MRFATLLTSYSWSENQLASIGITSFIERFFKKTSLAGIHLESSSLQKIHYRINPASNDSSQGLSSSYEWGKRRTNCIIRCNHCLPNPVPQHPLVPKSSQNLKLRGKRTSICCSGYEASTFLYWRRRNMLFAVDLFSHHLGTVGANKSATDWALTSHLTNWLLSAADITDIVILFTANNQKIHLGLSHYWARAHGYLCLHLISQREGIKFYESWIYSYVGMRISKQKKKGKNEN